MSMRKIYRKIAREHGVSPKEVREEMQAAIMQAYQNPPDDNITVAYQNRVPRKGDVPTPEEFIRYHFLFYGKDAEIAGAVLNTHVLTREIPGLGETTVTGHQFSWQALGEKLRAQGNSVVFARPDGADYEVIQKLEAADFIPLGMKLTEKDRTAG